MPRNCVLRSRISPHYQIALPPRDRSLRQPTARGVRARLPHLPNNPTLHQGRDCLCFPSVAARTEIPMLSCHNQQPASPGGSRPPLEFHLRPGETAGSRPLHAEVRLAHAGIIGGSDHSRQGACKILRRLRVAASSSSAARWRCLRCSSNSTICRSIAAIFSGVKRRLSGYVRHKNRSVQSPVVEHPLASRT